MMTPPAVGIGVLEVGPVPQKSRSEERFLHLGVRLEHLEAGEQLNIISKSSTGSDGGVDVETVRYAGVEVVRAVTWRRVNRPGALFERHVISQHRNRVTVVQRVSESKTLE